PLRVRPSLRQRHAVPRGSLRMLDQRGDGARQVLYMNQGKASPSLAWHRNDARGELLEDRQGSAIPRAIDSRRSEDGVSQIPSPFLERPLGSADRKSTRLNS